MSTHAERGQDGESAPSGATPEQFEGDHPELDATAAPTAPEKPADTTPAAPSKPATRRQAMSSRVGNTWVGLVAGAIILIILLIFILQNLARVQVALFFWHFTLPLGVLVLLSVIGGALIMALVGGVRILQLRRVARK